MKIQDKLIVDKRNINRDIDDAIERINEYAEVIDALAKKIELAKEAFEMFNTYISQHNRDEYLLKLTNQTLKKLENL